MHSLDGISGNSYGNAFEIIRCYTNKSISDRKDSNSPKFEKPSSWNLKSKIQI